MEVFINTHGNPVPVAYGEWVDLYTAEDVVLEPLEFKIISLGVSMQLPKGKYAVVVRLQKSRSHHGKQYWRYREQLLRRQ